MGIALLIGMGVLELDMHWFSDNLATEDISLKIDEKSSDVRSDLLPRDEMPGASLMYITVPMVR